MKKNSLVVLVALLLTACAGWKPYADVAVGIPIDNSTDYWLQKDRDWQCSKPQQAHIELGMESPKYFYVAWNHQSWWFCGRPFNSRPEVYSNQFLFGGRWGGQ